MRDESLKRFFWWAVLIVAGVCCIVVYLHLAAQHRQAKRELIYIKARQQAAEMKQQRRLQYQKRLREKELRRQYNQGVIVK